MANGDEQDEGKMGRAALVRRVIATEAGAALLAEIVDRHGPVLVHQSGGCCDGSSPMVYPQIGRAHV